MGGLPSGGVSVREDVEEEGGSKMDLSSDVEDSRIG